MDFEGAGYQLLFDRNPLPTFVSAVETLRIVLVNEAACRMYGWSRDELLAMTLRDIRPAEDVASFEARFTDETKRRESPFFRIARHRTKDGRILEVALEISRVKLGDESFSLAVVTNVTGIVHAERRFRLLVEHSTDGISLTSPEGIVEYVSPGGARILGRTPDEIVGKSAVPRTHPDDLPRWSPPAPGETRHHIARLAHRDGSWRWIESTSTNLTHDPAVGAYVTNYHDITERVAAQQRLEFLISATAAITYTARASGDFGATFIGDNVRDVLGHDPTDFITDSGFWLGNIHPDDRDAVLAAISDLSHNDLALQYRFRAKDGTWRWMRDVARVRRDSAGVPIEVVGYWIDVSDQVRADAAREEMLARVALAERMLSVGTLAAGVAHEINNPLAYVTANLAALEAELPNVTLAPASKLDRDRLGALVRDAREGLARMGSIVQDLRALSRPDDHVRGPVDLVQVLGAATKMAHTEIRHRARLVLSFPDTLPPVAGDATRLGQVFLNLLLNAAQALPEGRADDHQITLAARVVDGAVQVEVSDTGSGIAPAVLPRIFDPFFTTKAPGAGTGLGLSISHQIVHAMSGTITVASEPGDGTTFTVRLPITDAMPAHAAQPPLATAVDARVLLVDDEPALGRSLTLLLGPDIEVVAVTRAVEALARIGGGEHYDAILCDLMMPDINGMELYARLVEAAPRYTDRVVFMTGGAFTPQAREFLATTDRPHLEKPFSEAQLRNAIARITR